MNVHRTQTPGNGGAQRPVPRMLTAGQKGAQEIARGIHLLCAIMRRCYGPKRSRTIVARLLDSPLLVSSALRIAKDFECEYRIPNLGVRLLQEALQGVHLQVGDGGTTTAILIDELLRGGLRYAVAGVDPGGLRRGIDRASTAAQMYLRNSSSVIDQDAAAVGLLYTSGFDGGMARLMRQAVSAVGIGGTIRVVESTRAASDLTIHDGMFFERGLVSSLLASDTTRVESHLHYPLVFVTDRVLSTRDDVDGMLAQAKARNGSVFIVARDIDGDALTRLVTAQISGEVRVGAIRAPEYGEQRDEVLDDIAMSTGALLSRTPLTASSLPEYTGNADSVVITRDTTLIVGPRRNTLQCAIRLAQLEAQLGPKLTEYDQARVEQRIGNLRGKSAELRVGGMTDVEMGELHERCLNTLRALRQGVRSGTVPGAGRAYVQAAAALDTLSAIDAAEQAGIDLVRHALESPARQLLTNAGVDDSITASVMDVYRKSVGDAVYDVGKACWTDAYTDGLLDALPAVIEPLRVACSVASMLLNTGVVITDDLPVD